MSFAPRTSLVRGEVERHIGFVELLEGNTVAAIPHFERSLAARRESGAIDASLFAAQTLGSALVEVGRFADAFEPLLYALIVAERLDSPVDRARAGATLGELWERTGAVDAAPVSYEWTLSIAEAIGLESTTKRCRESLGRVAQRSDEPMAGLLTTD